MKYFIVFLGWLGVIFFSLFLFSMLMLQNWLAALLLVVVILLCLPPLNRILKKQFNFSLNRLLRFVLLLIVLFLFGRVLTSSDKESIYSSPEIRLKLMDIYDTKMQEWPVKYNDVFLNCSYGTIHVITCGDSNAYPLLLLHASGVSSWSWKYNAEELSKYFKIYAVDLIGDVGKSEYTNYDDIMRTGKDQADLYLEISDSLGLDSFFIAGASEGGFIASNIARYYPDRVEKIALLGPMGYAGATQSVFRIMLAQMFPLKFVQDNTFKWAFSANPNLEKDFGEWFRLLMSGCYPLKVAPLPLAKEERMQIKNPVLFVFGEKDNLVGKPNSAKKLVSDMNNVKIETVDAGHLMAAELPELINSFLIKFFKADQNTNNNNK